jgi:hypothetical protein
MSKLTEKETILIQAILDSEYGDLPTDEVYTEYLSDDCSLDATSVPGIVSSLKKKGIVEVSEQDLGISPCDGRRGRWMDTIALTESGTKIAHEAGLTSNKMEYWLEEQAKAS